MKSTAEMWRDVRESWAQAGADCKERLIPMFRAKAIVYVTAFVFVLSAAGVWLAWLMNKYGYAAPRDVHLSIATFAAAVAITGAFDGASQSRRSGFLLLLAFVSPIVVVGIPAWDGALAWMGEQDWTQASLKVGWWTVVRGLVPATLLWWFFNAADQRFAPDPPPDVAAGGDPMRALS